MNKVKEKIIEILKEGQPDEPNYEPNYDFLADQILQLFAGEMEEEFEKGCIQGMNEEHKTLVKEMVEKIEKLSTECLEKESDDYDKGCEDIKDKCLNILRGNDY